VTVSLTASGGARVATATRDATVTTIAAAPESTPIWRNPIVIAAAILVLGAGAWLAFGNSGTQASRSAATGGAHQPFDAVTLTRLTTTGTAGLAALSADGRYAAYVVTENRAASLWLRQVTTASNVQIVPPLADAVYDGVTFSPDGNYIYYTIYPRVRISGRSIKCPCSAAARARSSRTSTARPRSRLTASALPFSAACRKPPPPT
jgi:hypothetical protein